MNSDDTRNIRVISEIRGERIIRGKIHGQFTIITSLQLVGPRTNLVTKKNNSKFKTQKLQIAVGDQFKTQNSKFQIHYSVLMLSTGLAVATRHDCIITVMTTTAETRTNARGKSHQWMGVCSAKLSSQLLLSHQPTGAATTKATTRGRA